MAGHVDADQLRAENARLRRLLAGDLPIDLDGTTGRSAATDADSRSSTGGRRMEGSGSAGGWLRCGATADRCACGDDGFHGSPTQMLSPPTGMPVIR